MTIAFPFRPQLPITEKIEYKNTIMRTYKGVEQRINRQDIPNYTFIYNVKKTGFLTQYLEALTLSQRDNYLIVPFWVDLYQHINNISSGVSSLTFNTTKKRFNAGDYCFIWESDTKNEYLEIDTVTDSSISFTTTIHNNYTGGQTYVMPAYKGFMIENPEISYNQTECDMSQFTFICESNYEFRETYTTELSYQYYPILTDCEVFSGTTGKVVYTGSSETLDIAGGILDLVKKWDYAKPTRTFGFKKTTEDEIWNLRLLLNYLKGSFKPICIPSMKNDLIPVGDVSSSTFNIIIKNFNYTNLLNSIDTRKYILIFNSVDSSFTTKEIINFEEIDSDTERCNLTETVGLTGNANTLKIMFLIPYRATSDIFEIQYNYLYNADCFINFSEEFIEFSKLAMFYLPIRTLTIPVTNTEMFSLPIVSLDTFSDAPIISFEDNTITMTGSGDIYYTLSTDGFPVDNPTTDDTLYTEPILYTPTTAVFIKASSFLGETGGAVAWWYYVVLPEDYTHRYPLTSDFNDTVGSNDLYVNSGTIENTSQGALIDSISDSMALTTPIDTDDITIAFTYKTGSEIQDLATILGDNSSTTSILGIEELIYNNKKYLGYNYIWEVTGELEWQNGIILEPNNVYDIAISKSKSTGKVLGAINGSSLFPLSAVITNTNDVTPFSYIGNNSTGVRGAKGYYKDVRVFDRFMTWAELEKLTEVV